MEAKKPDFGPFYLESALSFANFTLLNGVFLVGIALLFGATSFQIGLLVAIPLFANVFQIFSSYLIGRTGNRKTITIHTLAVARLVWIAVILIAADIFKTDDRVLWLALVVLVSSIFTSIGNLSLFSWIAQIVPENLLAKFFSKRNMFASAAGIIIYLIGAFFINYRNDGLTFAFLFIVAVLLGLVTLPILSMVHFEKSEKERKKFFTFLKEIFIPLKDERFRPFLYFISLWGFAINFASPFFLVYMLRDLGISFFIVASFLVIDSLSRIYGMRVWGRMGDSLGAKGVLLFSATISSTIPFWFIFINKSNYYLIVLILIISAFSYAAVDISLSQLLFKLAPRKNDSIYLTSFYGISGFFSGLGPIFGGILATFVKTNFNFAFSSLLFVFGASFILRVLTLPLVSKIEERDARDIQDVIGKVNELRFVSFISNFYSISHMVSKVVLLPQEQLRLLQVKSYNKLKDNVSWGIHLTNRAIKAVERKTNMAHLENIIGNLSYVLSNTKIPRRYSEYKAVQEANLTLEKVYFQLKSHKRITKEEKEELKAVIRQDRNVLQEFFDRVILLKKRYK